MVKLQKVWDWTTLVAWPWLLARPKWQAVLASFFVGLVVGVLRG